MNRFLIFARLFHAAAALAQKPPPTPEVSSEESTPTFSSRVNLVPVPVVVRDVRDRDGRAVGNLTREDFQLFDKGKAQLITKFAIEQTEGFRSIGETTAVRPAPCGRRSIRSRRASTCWKSVRWMTGGKQVRRTADFEVSQN